MNDPDNGAGTRDFDKRLNVSFEEFSSLKFNTYLRRKCFQNMTIRDLNKNVLVIGNAKNNIHFSPDTKNEIISNISTRDTFNIGILL